MSGGGEVYTTQGDSPLPCPPGGLDLGRDLLYPLWRELFFLLIDRIRQSCFALRNDFS
jgi:hypothetical protein